MTSEDKSEGDKDDPEKLWGGNTELMEKQGRE